MTRCQEIVEQAHRRVDEAIALLRSLHDYEEYEELSAHMRLDNIHAQRALSACKSHFPIFKKKTARR